MPAKVGEATKQDIMDMYTAGLKPADIAGEACVSLPVVYRTLHEAGLWNGEKGRLEMPLEKQDAVMQLWLTTSKPVPEIAEEVDIAVSSAYNLIHASGVPRPEEFDRKKIRIAMLEAAVVAWQEGAPIWQIKRDYEVSATQLYAYLHEKGIHPRRGRSYVSQPRETKSSD